MDKWLPPSEKHTYLQILRGEKKYIWAQIWKTVQTIPEAQKPLTLNLITFEPHNLPNKSYRSSTETSKEKFPWVTRDPNRAKHPPGTSGFPVIGRNLSKEYKVQLRPANLKEAKMMTNCARQPGTGSCRGKEMGQKRACFLRAESIKALRPVKCPKKILAHHNLENVIFPMSLII